MVTFMAVNQGKLDHEAVLIKTDKSAKGLVLEAGSGKINEEAVGEAIGEVEVEANATGAATFNLTSGHYILICNIPAHYAAGMFAEFAVTGVAPVPAKKEVAPAAAKVAQPAAVPAVPGEKKEVTLVKTARPPLASTVDALQKGDLAAAQKAFAQYDPAWNGIEVYVNYRSTQMYSDLEADLEAKVQAALDAPQAKAADVLPIAQALLAKYDDAIKLVQTGPAISPLFDDVAAIRMARAPLRAVGPALKAGDIASAKSSYLLFQTKWSDVEDLIHARSSDAYSQIEGAMAKANTAFQKNNPDAAELTPLVATVLERYNFGLNFVNASARSADLTKTTYAKDDVQAAAGLVAMQAEVQASLASWKGGNYADAGARAQRADGALFTSVSPALKAKNADAALKKALDAYVAVAGGAGDPITAQSTAQAAVEQAAIAQQWVIGQFWTDPKLKDAISQAAATIK